MSPEPAQRYASAARKVHAMDDGEFRIVTATQQGELSIKLSGEFDLANIEEFHAALEGCGAVSALSIDTTDLAFIGSTGLGALVEAKLLMNPPDQFTLIPGNATTRLLRLSGTEAFFQNGHI